MTYPHAVVLHGHFYQPPREDPWTDLVPEQPSAAPFHDWNDRIEHECYGPVVSARILDGEGRDQESINTLEWMSFNFGPTLLVWLEEHAPETYAAVLDADRLSQARLGHGNAIAMPAHHPILPLASERDRRTEIRWGIADFERRFGRRPEGMWLPETAVDEATLDALAAEGIRFTILAPHQVDPVPERGRPALFRTQSGREIALFIYDGSLSHDVAFGALLRDGVEWAERMAPETPLDPEAGPEVPGPSLVSLATDGETFGHHHTFAEMALAKALMTLEAREDVVVENYASFLARHGADASVRLVAPSAWSCAHGVGRWNADCGCKADPSTPSQQAWRGPLRRSLEWLSRELATVFEDEGGELFTEPWAARDQYGTVVTQSRDVRVAFVHEAAPSTRTDPAAAERALELLEMQRNALRLFTSCAWFFDDVDRLEPRQVLAYAARALEQAGPQCPRIREGFLTRLEEVACNDEATGSAADVFLRDEAARRS